MLEMLNLLSSCFATRCCELFMCVDFLLVKHALSKHENVIELKRESNNAKREVMQLSNRLKEVHGELLRSEKK